MANTLANTSIYQSDLSGFKKPIVPAPKPQGNQNYSASSYLNNAPAFQQVALWMAKWNSPQAETQARYGGSPKSSKSTQSSSKSTAPTLPNKSTLPTPPSTKRSSSVYTPPVPAIPWANPLDELYKRTPPPIKAELEAPKVATTTTPVIDLTKKQDDVYTPANYDFIDTMDIKGLKNLYRSFEYDKQQGKTLTKDQQLQMLYAQDRIWDLTKPQTMENPIDPIEEQRKQEKLQRQAELEAEQKLLITAQDNNEKQYIESQNILLQQAEDEQKKVMWYILWWQGAGTSSYWAEQLNKIGMNFTAQKQALLSESQERIQKYRAELSGASATELAKYDTNIQQLQLLSAQYDIDNVKAINEYNMQEWKDLASKFTALYDTSVLQAKAKAPLTAEETALAWYYSNFLVKDDWSLDPTTLALLEKTNPLLINSAVEQGIAIQKDRMNKGWDYSFANLWWWQIAVQDPKTWKVEFIQGNRQNEYDYQKDAEWNVYAINKTDSSDVKLVIQWSTNPMDTPSTDTTSFLKKWEWFREKAYQDSAWVWTVWYGFTTISWKPVKQWDTIDRGTADSLLQDKIWQYQNRRNFVTTPLSSDQETALTSFEYNLWQGIRQTTWANIINSINNGDIPWAISILKQHINAWWKPIKWLVNRRNEEAKLLQNTQWWDTQPNPNNFPQYANYIESWKLPAWMKDNSPQADTFKSQALEWYLMNKEQELNGMWLTIYNPTAFSSTVTNTPKRKAINEALSRVPAFKNTMDQLINITREYWTELIPWNAKRQISMLVRDAQLQAKEIYNLWVLNWPDLSLMEAIISNPTERSWKINQWFWLSYVDTLEKAKQKILDNAYTQANAIWLAKTDTKSSTTPTQSNTNPWILASPNKPTTTTTEVNSYLKGLWY